jgi:type III restriction enzyme
MPETIDQLIVNSPFEEPRQYWRYERETRTFSLEAGRRPAGYVRATAGARTFDDPGVFVELPLPNQIRPRVKAWREAGYPGVTGITRRLLAHWRDSEERGELPFFFCQMEAIETLIWLAEASPAERQGIDIPGDGGEFARLCAKMATGSGKTLVMAMLIAWQVLNKVTYPQDKRFCKNVFVVAPGLTVKSRLQVLIPTHPDNFYDEFNIVPPGLHDQLRQGKVLVRNWHMLMPLRPAAGPKVVKKGPESDEAFCRRVLEDLATAQHLLVINDEAHHAWRVPPKSRIPGVSKDEVEEATHWVGGLDRINRSRGILTCYDFSATPLAPTGKQSGEETLFGWIVSDFGLNDAIESGLVKTPRVVVRDDGRFTTEYKSRLYHIYADPEVRADLNRPAQETEPLPDLVMNAYWLLAKDWRDTADVWKEHGLRTPPVMITVANRTETAARVYYTMTRRKIEIAGFGDPQRTLRIDSKVLKEAEERDEPVDVGSGVSANDEQDDDDAGHAAGGPARKLSKTDEAELLRRTVDTVGRDGKPGEQIEHVISVQMLSEGWDAKTVTHIMGLRAFESQLLCEQVVGRGLRRTSYEVDPATGLYTPEYVNIFGVPFTFLPHEGSVDTVRRPQDPGVPVFPDPAKAHYAVSWPNVVRIEQQVRPRLSLDTEGMAPLRLNATDSAMIAELSPILEGKTDLTRVSLINLEEAGRRLRLQSIIFRVARDVYEEMQPGWQGEKDQLLAQVIGLVERFINAGRIEIVPPVFGQDELRRRILLTLNMNKLVQHVWDEITYQNVDVLVPVFDTERPIRSTGDMRTWYTRKPRERTERSHINLCVFDSTWEATEAYVLDTRPDLVSAWVKNDHLGFEIPYLYQGVVSKYRPDFLVRLSNGNTLVLEVKGQDTARDRAKRRALGQWVEAINSHGGFGRWKSDVSFEPGDVVTILQQHAGSFLQPASGTPDAGVKRRNGATISAGGVASEGGEMLAAARQRGEAARAFLLHAEGEPLSDAEVARLTRSSLEEVDRLRRAGALIGLPAGDGSHVYPRWQFDLDVGATLQGLTEVLAKMQVDDPWMQAAFFLRANARLRGTRPLDALRSGDIEGTRRAAGAYGEQGAA